MFYNGFSGSNIDRQQVSLKFNQRIFNVSPTLFMGTVQIPAKESPGISIDTN